MVNKSENKKNTLNKKKTIVSTKKGTTSSQVKVSTKNKVAKKKSIVKKKNTKKVIDKSAVKKIVSKPKLNNFTKTKSIKKVVKKPIFIKQNVIKQKKKVKTTLNKSVNKIIKSSNNDVTIAHESLNLVKLLNTEVQKVKDVKDNLKYDLLKLQKRIVTQENMNLIPQSKTILDIKEEVLKDFKPFMKKINLNSIKNKIFSQITQSIEIESEKLRSELNSKNTKTKKNFVKKISDLEIRLIESLNNNKKLQTQIKRVRTNDLNDIESFQKEIKQHISNSINKANEKYSTILNTTNLDINELKKNISNQKRDSTILNKKISEFKDEIRRSITIDEIDNSSIVSKLKKLEDDNSSIKSLVEKYEDELFDRKKSETLTVENKVRHILKDIDNKLNIAKSDKDALEDFIAKKINDVIDFVNSFEGKIKNIEKQDLKNTEKKILKKLSDEFINYKKEADVFLKKLITDLNNEAITIQKVSDSNTENVNNILTKIEEYYKLVNSEREIQKNSMIEKHNDLVNEIDKRQKKLEKIVINTNKNLNDEVKLKIDKLTVENKEDISKVIASNNEFLTQISNVSKETNRNLKEEIDNKFINSKEQFETQFSSHLLSFDTELKSKEQEFLEKLSIIEDNKKEMLIELNNFKDEIGTLTKEYMGKINDEMNILKRNEIDFENKKDSFIQKVDDEVKNKQLELDNFTSKSKVEIVDILNEQKETFKINDNSFRELFNEKNSKLNEFLIKRLESIEKKFVDKNLKYVTSILDKKLDIFKTYETDIKLKEDELELKISQMKQGHEDFFIEMQADHKSLNNKIEKNLSNVEKTLSGEVGKINYARDEFNEQIITINETLKLKIDNNFKTVDEKINNEVIKINSARDVFNEQITTMNETLKLKIDSKFENVDEKLNNEVEKINSARDKFNEQITAINETLKLKIDSKFKDVDEKLNNEVEKLNSKRDEFNEQITAINETLKLKIDKGISSVEVKLNIEVKNAISAQEKFNNIIDSEHESLNEKVEERMMNSEQQFNKRFLNYESSISIFKSTVIDEVEDAIKEINNVISIKVNRFDDILKSKVNNFDSAIKKINHMAKALKVNFNNMIEVKDNLEKEITINRDSINDVQVAMDLIPHQQNAMDHHIKYMKEYEIQLESLIRTLSGKGMSKNQIRTALSNKGHPTFYVSLILNDMDNIFS